MALNGIMEHAMDIDADTTNTESSQPNGINNPASVDPDAFGHGVKELVDVINRLEHLGVEASVPLPKIVVVGDQSAGKSSLIEAISEIKVPRSAGTCTRAPLQIKLAGSSDPSAPWKCTVELIENWDYRPDQPRQTEGQENKSYYPWFPKDPGVQARKFAEITNKNDLENVLRRAQNAVLNPGINHNDITDDELEESTIAQFSPNVVSLNIEAPNLPNLSFYDLTGIINQTEHAEDRHLIKLVKRMVKHYIDNDSALVVLALSMEGDAHNSTAAKIVRDVDGCEARCTGVLTKPDRMAQGNTLQGWRSILTGEKFALGNHYFVTKQPSQQDLDHGISHTQARIMEDEFFMSQDPWCSEFAEFSPRFGTRALKQDLSFRLTKKILECLPNIREKVGEKIKQIQQRLEDIPEPPIHDAEHIIRQTLSSFSRQFYADLTQQDRYFRLEWKDASQLLYSNIMALLPMMIRLGTLDAAPEEKGKKAPEAVPRTPTKRTYETIVLDDEDDEVTTTGSTVKNEPGRRKLNPSGRLGSVQQSPSERNVLKQEKTTPKKSLPIRGQKLEGRRFSLDEVRCTLHRYSDNDVPGSVDPQAFKALALASLAEWEKPLKVFLQSISKALTTASKASIIDNFRGRENTQFFGHASQGIQRFLRSLLAEQSSTLEQLLAMECHTPMTKNTELLKTYKQKELETLQTARTKSRQDARVKYLQEREDALKGSKVSTQGERSKLEGATEQTLQKLLGPDPYEQEVQVLADVRAYYLVAAHRFVDNILGSVQAQLLHRAGSEVDEYVQVLIPRTNTGVDKHECARLLADDPQTERERTRLNKEMQALLKAQGCLDELEGRYQS